MCIVWAYWVEGMTEDNQWREMVDYYTGNRGFEWRSLQEISHFTKKTRVPTSTYISL